jgi:hypothetical protein
MNNPIFSIPNDNEGHNEGHPVIAMTDNSIPDSQLDKDVDSQIDALANAEPILHKTPSKIKAKRKQWCKTPVHIKTQEGDTLLSPKLVSDIVKSEFPSIAQFDRIKFKVKPQSPSSPSSSSSIDSVVSQVLINPSVSRNSNLRMDDICIATSDNCVPDKLNHPNRFSLSANVNAHDEIANKTQTQLPNNTSPSHPRKSSLSAWLSSPMSLIKGASRTPAKKIDTNTTDSSNTVLSKSPLLEPTLNSTSHAPIDVSLKSSASSHQRQNSWEGNVKFFSFAKSDLKPNQMPAKFMCKETHTKADKTCAREFKSVSNRSNNQENSTVSNSFLAKQRAYLKNKTSEIRQQKIALAKWR